MSSKLRLFTLSEANTLLPQIDQLILNFLKEKESYARRHDVLFMEELLTQKESGNGRASSGEAIDGEAMELEIFLEGLEKFVDEIRAFGCIVRNIEQGWIDFPAKLEGELIYLCWRRGEKAIRYYHTPGDSVTTRRPLWHA